MRHASREHRLDAIAQRLPRATWDDLREVRDDRRDDLPALAAHVLAEALVGPAADMPPAMGDVVAGRAEDHLLLEVLAVRGRHYDERPRRRKLADAIEEFAERLIGEVLDHLDHEDRVELLASCLGIGHHERAQEAGLSFELAVHEGHALG